MLSGVGPSKHLKDKGIEVVHNLEGVGKKFTRPFGNICTTRVQNFRHFIFLCE